MSSQATSCALLLLAATLPCAAADKPAMSPTPAGYHDVKVGETMVRVRDTAKPVMHGGDSDDSHSLDLGKTSPLSNKSFDTKFASLSKNDSANESLGQKKFVTSSGSNSFATANYNQSDRKFQTVAYNSESSRRGSDYNKPFVLPPANARSNQSFITTSSDLQGKKALVAQTQSPSKADPFAAPDALNEKTFFDPEMKHVRQDPYAGGLDVKRLADLPNRTLTIDEVRNLINHEQIPNLNQKPDEEQAKPLNDPKWEPPTVAPMERDTTRATPPEVDKDGDLPAPGEMAQPPPENSEPLPK